ncbi:MAG TPA: DUF433 domain-containing protein [Nitrolancea sp.]|jgi:uncharacterized protein (DUF433 family)|nr:DUF433 domain-containing protein [Nitrolancea sp.]
MDHWFDAYIVEIPHVQGGAPVVKGTRTSVRSVVLYLRTYADDRAEVQRALPHLSEIEIDAALAFYRQNRTLIDADIERHERARQQIRAASA